MDFKNIKSVDELIKKAVEVSTDTFSGKPVEDKPFYASGQLHGKLTVSLNKMRQMVRDISFLSNDILDESIKEGIDEKISNLIEEIDSLFLLEDSLMEQGRITRDTSKKQLFKNINK